LAGREQTLEAVVDTGFSGSLTLPPAVIARLGLLWRTRGSATLANGSVDQFDIYAATVLWDGAPRNILVEAADTDPLVGMRLLHRHDLRMQVIEGGTVTIEALPHVGQVEGRSSQTVP
jgi:clan AA aspartic protease